MQYPPNVRIIRTPCTGRLEGDFYFKAFESGVDGVLVVQTVPITVHASLAASFTTGNASSGSPATPATPVNFTSKISGGTAPYTVSWSFGDGSMATGPAVTHSYATAGSYRAEVQLTDAVGATLTSNLTVTIAPPPSATTTIASPGNGFDSGLFLGLVLGGVLAAVVLFVFSPRKGQRPPAQPVSPYVPP